MNKTPKLSKNEISAAYDQAFATTDQCRDADSNYRWVLSKLQPAAGKQLLDIACGVGILIKYASKLGLRTYAIDLSPIAIKLSKERSPQSGLSVADGEALPFAKNSFDYVTNLGSLEHFTNPSQGLKEMQRMLKPDGVAAIFLPNSYYLVDIIWKVWRTGYSMSHHQVIERFATLNEWNRFIEENGFVVKAIYKYNHIFPHTVADWQWYWKHPKRIALTLVAPFVPRNLSYHFLYICQKTSTSQSIPTKDSK